MEVVGERLDLPASYGSPTTPLAWAVAEERLTAAMHHWIATTRPDGRPHSVPVDGVWLDDTLLFGGDPATVHVRNLVGNPRVVAHTESGDSPVIVEGVADWYQPGSAYAKRLAAATKTKYGFGQSATSYRAGLWRLQPPWSWPGPCSTRTPPVSGSGPDPGPGQPPGA